MNLIKYIILGIIQGITEPLPISSSGHIQIFKELFNTKMFDDLNFETFVNFGSFIAIFIIFFPVIKELLTSFFSYIFGNKDIKKKNNLNFKYCLLIIVSSIPVGLVGFLFKDQIESYTNVLEVGVALLITGLMLLMVRNSKGTKKDKDITIKDAIIIGLMQMVALIPGISRSGATLVGCLLCKLDRDASLKYTFLLYFPVSVASFGLGMIDVIKDTDFSSILVPYTLGTIAAGIVTYFTYKWLSDIVKKGKLWKFSIYCFIVGILVLIYFR